MHSEEDDAELTTLSGASMRMMFGAVRPLGELLTTLPAGPRYPGMTAGPNFQASRRIRVTTHKAAAWAILGERLPALAASYGLLATHIEASHRLESVRHTLESLAAGGKETLQG